jgi:hypothetical protein
VQHLDSVGLWVSLSFGRAPRLSSTQVSNLAVQVSSSNLRLTVRCGPDAPKDSPSLPKSQMLLLLAPSCPSRVCSRSRVAPAQLRPPQVLAILGYLPRTFTLSSQVSTAIIAGTIHFEQDVPYQRCIPPRWLANTVLCHPCQLRHARAAIKFQL